MTAKLMIGDGLAGTLMSRKTFRNVPCWPADINPRFNTYSCRPGFLPRQPRAVIISLTNPFSEILHFGVRDTSQPWSINPATIGDIFQYLGNDPKVLINGPYSSIANPANAAIKQFKTRLAAAAPEITIINSYQYEGGNPWDNKGFIIDPFPLPYPFSYDGETHRNAVGKPKYGADVLYVFLGQANFNYFSPFTGIGPDGTPIVYGGGFGVNPLQLPADYPGSTASYILNEAYWIGGYTAYIRGLGDVTLPGPEKKVPPVYLSGDSLATWLARQEMAVEAWGRYQDIDSYRDSALNGFAEAFNGVDPKCKAIVGAGSYTDVTVDELAGLVSDKWGLSI